MTKNKQSKFFVIGLILYVVGIATATFIDLNVSMSLYNPNSTFGWFFESFGELVMPIIGGLSAMYLIRSTNTSKPLKAVYVLALLFNTLTAVALLVTHLKLNTILSIVVLLIYLVIIYFFSGYIPRDNQLNKKCAHVGLILSVAPIVIVNLLKFVWGRERFRHMNDPIAQFTPWYLIQGLTKNNEFMSFPSGHSANSSTILWITLLPLMIPNLNSKKAIFYGLAIVWFVLVMISRIIMGAHFMSDVLMGSLITFLIFNFLYKKMIRPCIK